MSIKRIRKTANFKRSILLIVFMISAAVPAGCRISNGAEYVYSDGGSYDAGAAVIDGEIRSPDISRYSGNITADFVSAPDKSVIYSVSGDVYIKEHR